MAANLSLLTCT